MLYELSNCENKLSLTKVFLAHPLMKRKTNFPSSLTYKAFIFSTYFDQRVQIVIRPFLHKLLSWIPRTETLFGYQALKTELWILLDLSFLLRIMLVTLGITILVVPFRSILIEIFTVIMLLLVSFTVGLWGDKAFKVFARPLPCPNSNYLLLPQRMKHVGQPAHALSRTSYWWTAHYHFTISLSQH